MIYYYDKTRHLVCVPYSIENLHKMADDLEIKRCWYHYSKGRSHYDIPKKKIDEISKHSNSFLISSKQIMTIINNALL